MYEKALATLVLSFVPFTSASADGVTHRAEAQFMVGGKGAFLQVPMPEESLGLPVTMQVEMNVGLRGDVGLENVSKTKAESVLFVDFGVDLAGANGAPHLAAGGQFALLQTLSAYDGAVDFSGESGDSLATNRDAESSVAFLTGESLKRFIEDSNSKSVNFTARGGASSSALGIDYFELEARQELVIEIVVTYFYRESPTGGEEVATTDLFPGALSSNDCGPQLIARPFSTEIAVC